MVGYGGIFLVSSSTKRNVVSKIVRECFKTLYIYGDESFGLAVDFDSNTKVWKSLNVARILELENVGEASLAIGICRYAIYGRPAIPNTPPFLDCAGRLILVARGILENPTSLRLKLLRSGHVLRGKDISELLVHMIEENTRNNSKNIDEELCRIYGTFKGVFSLILYDKETNIKYVLAKGLAEYVGMDEELIVVSSEPDILLKNNLKPLKITDGAIKIDDTKISIIHGELIKPKISLGKIVGGFDYHMEREMSEIPLIITAQRYAQPREYIAMITKLIKRSDKIFMIGSGSSYNSALYGGYIINELSEIQPIVQNATEFIYFHLHKVRPGDTIIANSQSGKTQDVMRAVTKSRMKGAIIIGVINRLGTPLMYASNVYLHIAAGIEVAVPATKTFIGQLTTFARLAVELSNLPENEKKKLEEEFEKLPLLARKTMERCREVIDRYASKIYGFDDAFVLGRGASFSIAAEGALKLKEVAHIHAEGLDAGEFRHGTKTFVKLGYPIVFLIPQDLEAREDTYDLISEVGEFVDMLIITDESDPFAEKFTGFVIRVPRIHDIFIPILYTIPLQHLALRLGVLRKKPIDRPPKLNKYVVSG